MREPKDNFTLVCRRMHALMQEPHAPLADATLLTGGRLDDLVQRLSQRFDTRKAA